MVAVGALDNLSFLTMAVLAVVGGAVAGALLTMFGTWLVFKVWLKKQLPWGPKKLLRTLGAIAGALLVAGFLHLSGGGWGLFGGGGHGTGSQGEGGGTGTPVPSAADALTKGTDAATPPAPAGTTRARITVLGGALVKGTNYYRIEGRPEPVDLKGVQTAVKGQQEKGRVAAVDILIYQNSLAETSEPVKQLRAWATEAGLTPNLVVHPHDIPVP